MTSLCGTLVLDDGVMIEVSGLQGVVAVVLHWDLDLTDGLLAVVTQTVVAGNMQQSQFCGCSFINSLAPGKFEWNFRHVIFKQIWVIDGWVSNMNVTGLHW